jgi:transcriptional regulator with PAS, ATPase and Fis domain
MPPPLREIKADIPVLAGHFLMKPRRRIPSGVREIAPGTMQLLMAYEWPGNIRELENVMERELSFCLGSSIQPEHLPESMVHVQEKTAPDGPVQPSPGDPLQLAVFNAEKEQLIEALRRTGGNRTQATLECPPLFRYKEYRGKPISF